MLKPSDRRTPDNAEEEMRAIEAHIDDAIRRAPSDGNFVDVMATRHGWSMRHVETVLGRYEEDGYWLVDTRVAADVLARLWPRPQ